MSFFYAAKPITCLIFSCCVALPLTRHFSRSSWTRRTLSLTRSWDGPSLPGVPTSRCSFSFPLFFGGETPALFAQLRIKSFQPCLAHPQASPTKVQTKCVDYCRAVVSVFCRFCRLCKTLLPRCVVERGPASGLEQPRLLSTFACSGCLPPPLRLGGDVLDVYRTCP